MQELVCSLGVLTWCAVTPRVRSVRPDGAYAQLVCQPAKRMEHPYPHAPTGEVIIREASAVID